MKNKPVEIIVEAVETLPPVYADKLRFNQIMLNLVSNAVKFTDEGSVTLKAEVQDEAPDKMLISVTDTGIGIPSDKIDAVFDRFRQAVELLEVVAVYFDGHRCAGGRAHFLHVHAIRSMQFLIVSARRMIVLRHVSMAVPAWVCQFVNN